MSGVYVLWYLSLLFFFWFHKANNQFFYVSVPIITKRYSAAVEQLVLNITSLQSHTFPAIFTLKVNIFFNKAFLSGQGFIYQYDLAI